MCGLVEGGLLGDGNLKLRFVGSQQISVAVLGGDDNNNAAFHIYIGRICFARHIGSNFIGLSKQSIYDESIEQLQINLS